MSKMAKKVVSDRSEAKLKRVINYMGSSSFELNPIDTLKLVACSSIFGEPQYYRSSDARKQKEMIHNFSLYDKYGCVIDSKYRGMTTTEVFQKVIDDALDYDFEATLRFAVELRNEFYMRLNPQVIMVRAALHPKRKEFTDENPKLFTELNRLVMHRADEPATQVTYYLWLTGDKKKMPSVLKRSIAKKLSELKPWQVNKYKNAEIGMINTVRIVHANSPVLDELMRTGTIQLKEDEIPTWEQLASAGMSWREIAEKQVKEDFMGHMALLRNLRNIFSVLNPGDNDLARKILDQLKDHVIGGKQFPFRYKSAYDAIKECNDFAFKPLVLDALEECIDIAVDNLPKLKGRTLCMSDNSGSAWNAFTSEYGKTTVADIDNLSSVIAVMASDYGQVVKFGDRTKVFPITKRNGVLTQTNEISRNGSGDVGGGTEAGIWHVLRDAIRTHDVYDNIFIFSDMQAGTGQLYGSGQDRWEYIHAGYGAKSNNDFVHVGSSELRAWGSCEGYIDVYKLIQTYRQQVNPAVNVFCVQTAGYTNTIMPMMSYRTAFLAGWTGKEVQFAAEYIKQWDGIESRNNNQI